MLKPIENQGKLKISTGFRVTQAMGQIACATARGSKPSGLGYILYNEYQCIRDIIDQHMVETTRPYGQ